MKLHLVLSTLLMTLVYGCAAAPDSSVEPTDDAILAPRAVDIHAATTPSTTQPALPALSAAATAAASLRFDIAGPWTDVGTARPVISSAGGFIAVDMSYAHRPTATGIVLDASTISVVFPDAGTFTGHVQAPNLIRWSNGSAWHKVYAGPMLFNLNGDNWTDGASAATTWMTGGLISVTLDPRRPKATGYAIDASTISVTFPDAATFIGRLQTPTDPTIRWSNDSAWHLQIIP